VEVMPEPAAVLAATKYAPYLRGESRLRQRVGRIGASREGSKGISSLHERPIGPG
jgi:hypothetical protein